MDLQELISRGRFIFSKGPERLRVFNHGNWRRNTSEIARLVRRHVNNVRRDLQLLADTGLIQAKNGKDGKPVKVEGFPVYEKAPLARTVSTSYFRGQAKLFPRTSSRPSGSLSNVTRRTISDAP